MAKEHVEAKQKIDAVLKLAAANWPRDSEVVIETSGSDPHARLRLPWYILDKLLSQTPETL